jgi:hypothetical protein
VDALVRSYSVWSHLAEMVFVQLAHAFSLNDVCDWLRGKRRAIAGFGVTPPARNTLAHANKGRSADFVQSVFWRTLAQLRRCEPGFGAASARGANCMDWAQHRRRSRSRRGGRDRRRGTSRPQGEGAVGRRLNAAAKLHLRLDTGSFLPACAIVDNAREHDNKRASEVCAGLQSGEVLRGGAGRVMGAAGCPRTAPKL